MKDIKDIKDIFELTEGILLPMTKKTVFFCEVEEGAYEIFYYVWLKDGSCRQCYDLAEEGEVEEAILDETFEKIAGFIQKTGEYDPEKRNVVTLTVEGINERVSFDKYDKSVGLYKIKKDWKMKCIL